MYFFYNRIACTFACTNTGNYYVYSLTEPDENLIFWWQYDKRTSRNEMKNHILNKLIIKELRVITIMVKM